MDIKNKRRFLQIHVIIALISFLIVPGCYSPDWSDKDADFLINQLKNNRDYDLREKAIYLLASKAEGRDKVIPALTHVLFNDRYGLVRAAAADVLGSIEPPAISAIPALIEALQREDMGAVSLRSNELGVHEAAIKSLGEMRSYAAKAIPALLEFFRSERLFWDDAGLAILKIDPSMRDLVKEELIERWAEGRAGRALVVLAEGGDVSLVPVLIQLLNHKTDTYARNCAAEVLKDIGTPEALEAAVPAFIQELNDPEAEDYVRRRAAEALKEIGTPEALRAVEESANQ